MPRAARYILTEPAFEDLMSIRDFPRSQSPAAADRVRAELEAAFRRLASSPRLGHRRDDLADDRHRFWTVYSYLVVYRHIPRPIQIVRGLHASRDIRRI